MINVAQLVALLAHLALAVQNVIMAIFWHLVVAQHAQFLALNVHRLQFAPNAMLATS